MALHRYQLCQIVDVLNVVNNWLWWNQLLDFFDLSDRGNSDHDSELPAWKRVLPWLKTEPVELYQKVIAPIAVPVIDLLAIF